MAPPPLVPKVYQVTTFGTLGSQPCDHVINWLVDPLVPVPAATVVALAEADAAHWMNAVKTLTPNFYTHTVSRCVYLGDLSVPPHEVAVGTTGTFTDPTGSHQVCWTIRHHVDVRGKGKQGRTNVPNPPSNLVEQPSGKWTTGALTEFGIAWSTFLSAFTTDVNGAIGVPPKLIVLNRKLGTYNVPTADVIDAYPNTHRRWQKRLSRHR
jgi:hypothetical protein